MDGFMIDKKIILIGNGSSVLDNKYGTKIDDFDIIVRFNNFKVKGYEKNVGTKTSYWFTWCLFNVDNLINIDTIYFHSWVKDKHRDKNYIEMIKLLSNIVVVEYSLLDEIKLEIPYYPHKSFSTGLIATHMMLKQYKQVYLYGFDWWRSGLKHHYGDNHTRGRLHHPKLEYQYYKKFMQLNRIVFL